MCSARCGGMSVKSPQPPVHRNCMCASLYSVTGEELMRGPMIVVFVVVTLGTTMAQTTPPRAPTPPAPPPPIPGQPERPLGNDPLSAMVKRLKRGLEPNDEIRTDVLTSSVAIKI